MATASRHGLWLQLEPVLMLTRRLCNPIATRARESLIPWRVLRKRAVAL